MLTVFITYHYFLGLRNLTVIDNACRMIRESKPDFSIDNIPTDEPAVYTMFSAGDTVGVFQFESSGMKRVLSNLRPEYFEDLIAVISLYRPGPMDSIPKYIYNRHHPQEVRYAHPLLEPILKTTYGCIVYQEQVMQILQALAGYSLGRADIVRRAMSKKKHDVMEQERDIFINGLLDENGHVEVDGCLRRGIAKAVADRIFDEMSSFASYAFNKSHAAAYAYVAYQTAYLKALYPREYLCALISSIPDPVKVAEYIREAKRLNIPVLPPHVNHSTAAFTPEENGIRFGLIAVKNIGYPTIEAICREREQSGAFASFPDFVKRMSGMRECNRRAIESLIQCGALDGLGANRRQMLENLSLLLERYEIQGRTQIQGQLGFFDDPQLFDVREDDRLPPLADYPVNERLAMEKEVTGLYLSGHPLGVYEPYLEQLNVTPIAKVLTRAEEHTAKADGETVKLFGMLSNVRTKSTRSGSTMANATLEDLTADMELVIFAPTLSKAGTTVQNGQVVTISGRLSLREDQPPSVVVDRLMPVGDPEKLPKAPQRTPKYGLYLRLTDERDDAWPKIRGMLTKHPGDRPVYIRFADSGKLVKVSGLSVRVSDTLLSSIRRLIGDDHVAIMA